MINIQLTCSTCGKEFYRSLSYVNGKKKRGAKNFYCSKECSTIGVSRSVHKTWEVRKENLIVSENNRCLYCDGLIEPGRQFCNAECYRKYRHENNTKEVNCFSCGKTFRKNIGQISRGDKHHYCSIECCGKGNTKLGTVTMICAGCGKEIRRRKNEARQWKNLYCSKVCHNEHMNKHMKKRYRSYLEEYLEEYFSVNYPNISVLYNDRKTLGGRELDLYFPDCNIAIEINGPYHYKPIFGDVPLQRQQKSDEKRAKMCNDLGIKLYVLKNMLRFSEELGLEYAKKIEDILNL